MSNKVGLLIEDLIVDRGLFSLQVDQIRVNHGQVHCVVGANGSGKTTLLETVTGIIKPTAGKVLTNGQAVRLDNPRSKKLVGYIPDDDGWLINELTASEYFQILNSVLVDVGIKGSLTTAAQLAKVLGFSDDRKQMGQLSHGNKKKVQIISGLMHRPPFLVVDELRNGLDPIAIRKAEGVLRDFSKAGMTILAATHDLWWAERFAGTIIMLHQGRVALNMPTGVIVRDSGSVEARYMEVINESLN